MIAAALHRAVLVALGVLVAHVIAAHVAALWPASAHAAMAVVLRGW